MFDRFLIDKVDTATTWLQRQHGVNLLLIQLICRLFTSFGLLFWVVISEIDLALRLALFLICGFIILVWAGLKQYQYSRDHDYPVNVRKMNRLNAMVVWERDHCLFRMFWTTYYAFDRGFNLYTYIRYGKPTGFNLIMETVFAVGFILSCYLECCVFLGPGEFAKNKQSVFSNDLATQRD